MADPVLQGGAFWRAR